LRLWFGGVFMLGVFLLVFAFLLLIISGAYVGVFVCVMGLFSPLLLAIHDEKPFPTLEW